MYPSTAHHAVNATSTNQTLPVAYRRMLWIVCLLFVVGSAPGSNPNAVIARVNRSADSFKPIQEGAEVRSLELGQLIERELKGGQSHSYQVSVGAGQYAYVAVNQIGIDVVVKLVAPDGKLITQFDSPNGSLGVEPVHIVAEATGAYRLEVSSFETTARPGRYEIKLTEIRSATEPDKTRLAAYRALDEAQKLHNQLSQDSLAAAIKKYEESLLLYRNIGDLSGQYSAMLGMGNAHWVRRELPEALEHFAQARQIAETLGDKFRQAVALDNASQVYGLLGDLGKQLQFGLDALQMYQGAGQKDSELKMLGYVGRLYSYLGEEDKSRDYLNQAMRMYQLLGDKTGEATMLGRIAYSYHLGEEPQKSVEYSNQALALWHLLQNKKEEALERSNLSSEYALAGERQKALDQAEQALAISRTLNNDPRTTGVIMTNVGRAYSKLGDFERALALYEEPLHTWQTLGLKRNEAITLKHISSALADAGRLDEAKINLEKSIGLLESLRDRAGNPELQSSFIATIFNFYQDYVDLMMRLHAANPVAGNDLAALAFNEKIKGRSLVDLLNQARVDLRNGDNDALLQLERNLDQRITAQLDDLAKLLRGTFTDAQKNTAEHEIETLENERRQVQAKIRDLNPRYAALAEPQPLSVSEIQQRVLDDDTILLEYALADEHSYVWLVTPDKVFSYQLPPKAEVEAQARRVYELLTAHQPAPGLTAEQQRARETAADKQYPTQALALSQMLLGPVASQLGTKRLLIVVDGALEYLPFAVLPLSSTPPSENKDYRPLILDHEIVTLPSVSVLAVLRREFANRPSATKKIAVLADPVFQVDDARVKLSVASRQRKAQRNENKPAAAEVSSVSSSSLTLALKSVRGGEGTRLRRLLFSRDEAEAILSMTPASSSLKALDFRANRKLATSDELGQYQMLHFSTHGLLDSRHPELSGLVLSLVDEVGQPQEGFLRLNEIYGLRLNADLVVLSACQTGLGRQVSGEGLIGLTRGFMYAGSKRVMASLWEVDDAATTELMKRFYKGVLQEKLPPAAALRAAQIEMLKRKHWQSPYYWGAFVLQGEWK